METAAETSQGPAEEKERASPRTTPDLAGDGVAIRVEPDLAFIRDLSRRGGDSLKQCMQCGTCSAVCVISPDPEPFPRKEMAWAAWGLKERLLTDPDVWLCYQCKDCSTRCPRGARPSEVLAAIRQESVIHYAAPRFLGRWVSQARYIPLLLAIPALLLGLALIGRDSIQLALGIPLQAGERIVYSYSSTFPHWLLNGFFLFFGALALIAAIMGVIRFWRALKAGTAVAAGDMPVKGLVPSIGSALKSIITHENFTMCTTVQARFLSHVCVLFGFLALTVVTIWVVTAGLNPLIRGNFIYPFSFWNPWKLLANAGGAAVAFGCFLMIRDRLRDSENTGPGTYFDWTLIATLLVVVVTGFATELLHYARLEPHRHVVYFIHLVFVFSLLIYLPYSKLAHLVYRTTALVYAEHVGRKSRLRDQVENSHEH